MRSDGEARPGDETRRDSQRRRTLAALCEHLAPPRESSSSGEDPATALLASLEEPRFAGQAPFVQALVDELDERSEGSFHAFEPADREELLRSVESAADPYLLHALRLVLRLALEHRLAVPVDGRLGDRDARM